MFNITSTSVFYDFKADINMRRLDAGIPNLNKLKARPDLTVPSLDSCVSVDNVIRAQTQRFKPKVLTLTNFYKTPARDEKILKQSERWANVQLENSKEERELEIRAYKAMRKQNSPTYFF